MTTHRVRPHRGIGSPALAGAVAGALSLLFLIASAPALGQSGPAEIPPPPPMDESAPAEAVAPDGAATQNGDARESQDLDPGLVPPTLDDLSREQALLERAEITLIQRGDERLREYRVEGQLILIEVIPDAGPSYFLVDTNGDGQFDTRRDDLGTGFVPPRWILFQW